MSEKERFTSGFVTLVGRPNVGKSTLMNCLLGEKLAIVSSKPQTTRNRIRGILTDNSSQIVFIDTPGIHSPQSRLGENMVKMAEQSCEQVDVILFLIASGGKGVHPGDAAVAERLSKVKTPVFLVINKTDIMEKPELLRVIDEYRRLLNFAEIIPVSALKADNTEDLLRLIRARLPEGPMYFPADSLTDQPERFIAAEIIREKALYLLRDEVPHGVAVEINAFKERTGKDMIDLDATIYCERDTHKGIIIGKNGALLKEMGTRARTELERLLAARVNLTLWVKVKKGWRDSDYYVKNFGYGLDRE